MPNDAAMRAALLANGTHIAAGSEDVGERFPDEARAIHYDEAPKRSIRGSPRVKKRRSLPKKASK